MKKRPTGNREAVRKYREKKEARAASLEDEVVKLRALNQHLVKRLQGQAALEAEIARLKCFLVDIRGRIEAEIGSFPYHYHNHNHKSPHPNLPASYVTNTSNVQCDDQVYCLRPGADGKIAERSSLNGQAFSTCEFETLQCLASQNLRDLPACVVGHTVPNVNASTTNKRKDPHFQSCWD